MGSAGSGKFGTYHVGNGETVTKSGQNGMTSSVGGRAGEIECPDVIEHIRLEDVAISEYYVNKHSLPNSSEAVELRNTIYKGRLVVTSTSTGEILGNLPTQYNYLINCIKRGTKYTGTVISSGKSPVPFVVVSLHA